MKYWLHFFPVSEICVQNMCKCCSRQYRIEMYHFVKEAKRIKNGFWGSSAIKITDSTLINKDKQYSYCDKYES